MPANTDPIEFDLPVSGVGMSTRELLLRLGFKPLEVRWTDRQPGYVYDFGNLLLSVAELTNSYLRPAMVFSGNWRDKNSFNSINLELPLTVECYEQGVALIAHCVGSRFIPMIPTEWLEQGRKLKDYLPGKRQMRLYDKRPKCFVEADWFKVAAKRLIALGAAADLNAKSVVSFDGSILKFETGKDVVAMPAQGEAWQHKYYCRTSNLQHISKRTPTSGVWLSVWEERLSIGRLRVNIESVKNMNVDSIANGEQSLREDRMKAPVAWCPTGIDEVLGSVLIQRGEINESQWWDALSDRVTRLAMQEPDPVKAVKWATNLMEVETFGAVTTTADPRQAGGCLVDGNWKLRENLKVYMNRYERPFPAEAVTDNLEIREVIEGTNLEQWVHIAIAYSSPSNMD